MRHPGCCICLNVDAFEQMRTARSMGISYDRIAEILQMNRSTIAACCQRHTQPYTPTDERRAEVTSMLSKIPSVPRSTGRPKKVAPPSTAPTLRLSNPNPTTREGLEEHFKQLTKVITAALVKTESNTPVHLKAIAVYQTTLDVMSRYVDQQTPPVEVSAKDGNILQLALGSIEDTLKGYPEVALKVAENLNKIRNPIEVKVLDK